MLNNRIYDEEDEMSDEEFDRVEQRVENALRAGKHVKF